MSGLLTCWNYTHLPQDGKQRLVDDAVLSDVVDGADDEPRRRPAPAEARRPEPLGVDAHEAPSSVVVDKRRDHEPRQPRRIDADVPRRAGLVDARTPHVDNHSLTTTDM